MPSHKNFFWAAYQQKNGSLWSIFLVVRQNCHLKIPGNNSFEKTTLTYCMRKIDAKWAESQRRKDQFWQRFTSWIYVSGVKKWAHPWWLMIWVIELGCDPDVFTFYPIWITEDLFESLSYSFMVPICIGTVNVAISYPQCMLDCLLSFVCIQENFSGLKSFHIRFSNGSLQSDFLLSWKTHLFQTFNKAVVREALGFHSMQANTSLVMSRINAVCFKARWRN